MLTRRFGYTDQHSPVVDLSRLVRKVKRIVERERTMSDYVPSPSQWVADQVALYESSGGTAGVTLRDTGLPVIIVTNRGRKTGAIRKTPLMRVVDGNNYILVASQGGAPTHPVWYYNLKADPNVEIRDKTEVYAMRVREVTDPVEREACGRSISALSRVPTQNRPPHPRLSG